ncbi:Cof-type HAD-IIB family hydrolase [Neobacillus sp. DY30]|uniref:Cof-type HAD-IIB family hydrolase n=1 Tax=Neobacillus sp. DY30 TaxID=3047871 RepID=UPI0024BF260E|nr:Cof-type HAD-IIB family hydrolase [Neobacillus sp. DY30]WHY00149.1 Cof-type HAD-IIB family hydrolase [Neobacillus sp. DY30]
MAYKLLATDLDGTLLNEHREIDRENIEAIHEYRKNGGRVVICSGRSPLSTRWIANTIGLKGEPIIAYNGAIILDENGENSEQAIFDHDRLLSFWELCEGEGFYAHFYEGDTLLVPKETKWNKNWIENNIPSLEKTGSRAADLEIFRGQCQVKIVDDFYRYMKCNQPDITKIAVFDEEGRLADFSKVIGEQIGGMEVSSSLNFLNLEISPSGVSKASSLLKLSEKYNIPISQIAAIGDNYNDSLMLKAAGLGIAMGNAPAEVKALADQVTGNNQEAGVAQAIRRYLL